LASSPRRSISSAGHETLEKNEGPPFGEGEQLASSPRRSISSAGHETLEKNEGPHFGEREEFGDGGGVPSFVLDDMDTVSTFCYTSFSL
jgi:hypothetical protein